MLQFKKEISTLSPPPGELLLKSNNIRSLQDLHYFFNAVGKRTAFDSTQPLNLTQLESVIEQDFLEKMPPQIPAR